MSLRLEAGHLDLMIQMTTSLAARFSSIVQALQIMTGLLCKVSFQVKRIANHTVVSTWSQKCPGVSQARVNTNMNNNNLPICLFIQACLASTVLLLISS